VIAEKPTMNGRKASAEAAAQVINCWQAADDPLQPLNNYQVRSSIESG
jgi:hypothetical protein